MAKKKKEICEYDGCNRKIYYDDGIYDQPQFNTMCKKHQEELNEFYSNDYAGDGR